MNLKRLLSSKVYISHTVIYNGKEVDPDSELGKRMRKVSGKMNEAFDMMHKAFNKMNEAFRELHF